MHTKKWTIGLLTAVALLGPASEARAHAQLERTTPRQGQELKRAPKLIRFDFGEQVVATPSAVRVFDQDGRRVDAGPTFHPGDDADAIAVKLEPHLPKGAYTATYHVVSADSHPVSGGTTFGIHMMGAPATTIKQRLAGQQAGPVTATAFGAARAIQYTALAIALGSFFFLLACWLPAVRLVAGAQGAWRRLTEDVAERARTLITVAAATGVASGLLGLACERAQQTGTGVWTALAPHELANVLDTRFGVVWSLGVLLWLGSAALLRVRAARLPRLETAAVGATGLAARGALEGPGVPALGACLGLLALVPVLASHAANQPILVPTLLAHIVAMSAWVGGIALLLVAVLPLTKQLPEQARTPLLAETTRRFSRVATYAVAAILATGILQSLIEVRSPGYLLDSAMGRAVLIKSVLLIGLMWLGNRNRTRSVPGLVNRSTDAAVLLRRTLLAEAALLLGVLAVSGALATYPEPGQAQTSEPGMHAMTTVSGSDGTVTVTARPDMSGLLHLKLTDAKTGRPLTHVPELTARIALPAKQIDPIVLKTRKTATGRYVARGAPMSPAGAWQLTLQVLTSAFDEHVVTLTLDQ